MEAFIILSWFLCGACLVWAVMWMIHPNQTRTQLLDLPNPSFLRPGVDIRRGGPFLPLLAFLGKLSPKVGKKAQELKNTLIYSGSIITIQEFQGVKVLTALAGFVMSFVVWREFTTLDPLVMVVAVALGWFAPDLWRRARITRRNRAILRVLPEVVDLLSLCMGAGLDFLGASNRVVLIDRFKQEPFIEELSLAMQEIKLGKRRAEALKAMAKRVNLSEVSSFVRAFVQADRMGTPVAEVLAMHAEDVRNQRFVRADRAALKAPIKLLVPLIFCIMPCVAIIVGAPVFIQFMKENPFGH